jgi:hypothetical protein
MTTVNLPIITLRRGPWQADVFDPRPHPALLGARYVHGGYVARLLRDGRELTGGSSPYWYHYDGCGLPETFESGLAWHLVGPDEEYLRVGAGRLLKKADEPGEMQASGAPLVATLAWEVETGPDHATFRAADQIRRRFPYRIGYRLERTIRLTDTGLVSTTTFTLDAPIARQLPLPLTWYAHPFFRHHPAPAPAAPPLPGAPGPLPPLAPTAPIPHGPGTGFRLPAHAIRQVDPPPGSPPQALPPILGPDGLWRFANADGGRLAFTGFWGAPPTPLEIHLDPARGGGRLDLILDRPLDHLVLWANDRAASIEPKLAKTWLHGETGTWSVTYRWA